MRAESRWCWPADWQRVDCQILADQIFAAYRQNGGRAHPAGARDPGSVRMHWSREWEYPWALLASGVRAGQRVLDLGCGGSPLPVVLAQRGCQVVGVDVGNVVAGPPSLRSYGDGRWPNPGGRFALVQADLRGPVLPFKDATFDGVFCISVLENLALEVVPWLRELARVVVPGGWFVATLDVGRPGAVGVEPNDLDGQGWQQRWPAQFTSPVLPPELTGTYWVRGVYLERDRFDWQGAQRERTT